MAGKVLIKKKRMKILKNVFGLFRIKREERWFALSAILLFMALNAMVIYKYYRIFTPFNKHYWHLFVDNFHISGFDPLTYSVLSDWDTSYNVYRHPLLAFFMYIPYQLNQGLMSLTGINCAQFVEAAILLFCAVYSVVFAYRIFREVVGVARYDATLLAALLFSFAYILVTEIVPDHFALSMLMLIMVLYVSGKKMVTKRLLSKWQTVLLFVFTAGVSLNNGIKVFLASLFTNGKKFFRPLNLILAVILPALLMWWFCNYEYDTFVWPPIHAKQERMKKAAEAKKKRDCQMPLAKKEAKVSVSEAAKDAKAHHPFVAFHAQEKPDAERHHAGKETAVPMKSDYKPDTTGKQQTAKSGTRKDSQKSKGGKPISNEKFLNWTDVTTSRTQTAVENLFGESIQLHQDYLLGDVLNSRPMIVNYRWVLSYVVEGIIVLLFIIGIFFARRSRFFWMAFSWFLFDMAIHIVLGFGINEVYIMSAHWIFIIPIAIAFLMKAATGKPRLALRILLTCVTAYLYIYNVWLIAGYLL